MILAIDFDGTIAYSNYPDIGDLLPGAVEVITNLRQRGHTIIINSCRAGNDEKQMKDFLRYSEVPYDYINKNCPRQIKLYGGDTRKISCDISFDDKSFFMQEDFFFNGKDVVQDLFWSRVNNVMEYLEKPLVICIIGESGSGKTMLANYLTYEYGINQIESYTDRPMRTNNEKGHTFVSPELMDTIMEGEMLAYTKFGDYHYCCLYSDIAKVNSYVIDEAGVDMLRKEWSDKLDIYTIRLHREEEDRIKSVGAKRVARDSGRFTFDDSYYDFVIHNPNNDKEHVFSEVREFVKEFRLENRFMAYEPVYIEDMEG